MIGVISEGHIYIEHTVQQIVGNNRKVYHLRLPISLRVVQTSNSDICEPEVWTPTRVSLRVIMGDKLADESS